MGPGEGQAPVRPPGLGLTLEPAGACLEIN
jgi:hypothetical protein